MLDTKTPRVGWYLIDARTHEVIADLPAAPRNFKFGLVLIEVTGERDTVVRSVHGRPSKARIARVEAALAALRCYFERTVAGTVPAHVEPRRRRDG